MPYQIGCFNRPWNQADYDECLAAIAGAGYEYTGFMNHQGSQLVQADHTPEQVKALAEQVAKHGLKPSTVLTGVPLGGSADECATQLKRVVDHTKSLGATHVLTCGTTNEELYDKYYGIMRLGAEYAESQGVVMTLKPHGGISATARDLLRAVEQVDHPNFGIYYDPGNIIHYTGENPTTDVPIIAEHVVGVCVKDCAELKGAVMIHPGEGNVDFEAVFGTLKQAGFGGPVCVECLGGATPEELADSAKRTREMLASLLQ